MSHALSNFGNLLGDLFTGNFTGVEKRISDWWASLSPALQTFVHTIETDEGKIIQGLVVTAATDLLSGGLTTDNIVAAAKDVGAKLLQQNIVVAYTTIFAALNAEVSGQTAVAGTPVPTNDGIKVIAAPIISVPAN